MKYRTAARPAVSNVCRRGQGSTCRGLLFSHLRHVPSPQPRTSPTMEEVFAKVGAVEPLPNPYARLPNGSMSSAERSSRKRNRETYEEWVDSQAGAGTGSGAVKWRTVGKAQQEAVKVADWGKIRRVAGLDKRSKPKQSAAADVAVGPQGRSPGMKEVHAIEGLSPPFPMPDRYGRTRGKNAKKSQRERSWRAKNKKHYRRYLERRKNVVGDEAFGLAWSRTAPCTLWWTRVPALYFEVPEDHEGMAQVWRVPMIHPSLSSFYILPFSPLPRRCTARRHNTRATDPTPN